MSFGLAGMLAGQFALLLMQFVALFKSSWRIASHRSIASTKMGMLSMEGHGHQFVSL